MQLFIDDHPRKKERDEALLLAVFMSCMHELTCALDINDVTRHANLEVCQNSRLAAQESDGYRRVHTRVETVLW